MPTFFSGTSIFSAGAKKTVQYRDAARGGAGGAAAPPDFGRSVNPISARDPTAKVNIYLAYGSKQHTLLGSESEWQKTRRNF